MKTFSMPRALTMASMFMILASWPMAVLPEPGVGWWPVMATMLLSMTMTQTFALL